MHSLDTLVCQSWGKYRWNMEIAGQNVLFWRGSIKVTTSDCMRVSHSGTSKLKIPEILKIFWPASEPCREATRKYSDSIFPVSILRTRSYPPCKYEGVGMHSLDTLVCQSWGKYRWNMVIAGQNVLFWMGSIKVTSDCMRISHTGTSKLKNPEILKIFWPASEPCREATSKYSDSIFPVPILPTRSYPPCKYEGMGMHSLDTLVCQSWGKYRWNMEIAGQNVLFWRGSIKVTTSDCMRVSHSGTSKLKIPEILKIFWPASEPCREATRKYSDSIFPVSILRTRSYPPCKYEGVGMHSLDTLVCQSWGKYRWNMEIAGQNVLFWMGSIKVTTSDCMRVSHSGTSKLKIPEILKIFWPASEPCREATRKYSDSIFPVSILRTRSYPPCKYEGVGMHSLDTLVCQSWGKYRWNMVIAGQNVLFWMGSIKVTSDCMRISHSGTSKLKIPEILKIFWLASEPCRGNQ